MNPTTDLFRDHPVDRKIDEALLKDPDHLDMDIDVEKLWSNLSIDVKPRRRKPYWILTLAAAASILLAFNLQDYLPSQETLKSANPSVGDFVTLNYGVVQNQNVHLGEQGGILNVGDSIIFYVELSSPEEETSLSLLLDGPDGHQQLIVHQFTSQETSFGIKDDEGFVSFTFQKTGFYHFTP